jgi:hypothetical protein
VAEETSGVSAVGWPRWWREICAVEPALAVDVRGGPELLNERPIRGTGPFGRRSAEEVEHRDGVDRGPLEAGVAPDRGDAGQISMRACECDRERVVVARVAIEEQSKWCAHGRRLSQSDGS